MTLYQDRVTSLIASVWEHDLAICDGMHISVIVLRDANGLQESLHPSFIVRAYLDIVIHCLRLFIMLDVRATRLHNVLLLEWDLSHRLNGP